MNAIHNYITALFSSLPQTPDVLRMQAEMMENMDEKYHDLLREGKSEAEAIGLVLSGIGSAEDLKKELGIADEPIQTQPGHGTQPKHDAFLAEYAAFKKKFAAAIACGVVLCIVGALLAPFVDNALHTDAFTAAALLVPVAAAVAIFIYFGIREDWYDEQYKTIFCEASKTSSHTEKKDKRAFSSVVSSILFPLAVILYLYIGFAYGLWHPGWIIFPICAVIVGAIEAVEGYRK